MSDRTNAPGRRTRTPADIMARDARDRLQNEVMRDPLTRPLWLLWLAGKPADWKRGQEWTVVVSAVFAGNHQDVLDVGTGYLGMQVRMWLREQLAARAVGRERGGGAVSLTKLSEAVCHLLDEAKELAWDTEKDLPTEASVHVECTRALCFSMAELCDEVQKLAEASRRL